MAESGRAGRRREWTRAELIEIFGSVLLFSRLPGPQLEAVALAAERQAFRRGALIIRQGTEGDGLYVVASGSVLVSREARSGSKRALNVIEAPGSFGELALLDNRTRSASIEALEDSELFCISRESFLGLLSKDPRLVDGLIRELGRMIRRLSDQVADEGLLDLPSRVAKTLLRLIDHQGPLKSGDQPVVALTQGKLADLAGGSRQSVNGALSSFVVRGLIRIETRQIVITDLAGLRARAGVT
ncbi:MAG TPA: Crp/Fnr family transcriptional regulator [Mycobacteriales bacterium]|nr:Crp/Fnr family transcriptional regulator [Mycobacteriales bacterium]